MLKKWSVGPQMKRAWAATVALGLFVALIAAPLPVSATGGGAVGAWQDDLDLNFSAYAGAASVTYNGYVYSVGGEDGAGNAITSVLYAHLGASGAVGAWASTTSLPQARDFVAAVASDGYLYILGGSSNGSFSSSVYYAPINANGSLGSWTATGSLPSAKHKGTTMLVNGYIYYVGGYNGTFTNHVYYAPINHATGAVSSWTTTTSLPVLLSDATSVAANGRVYIMGGYNSAFQSAVYTATLNANGTVGAWSTTAALPAGMNLASAALYNGYVYVMGGQNSGILNTVFYTRILPDGTMAPWQTASHALPRAAKEGSAVAYNGFLYYLGGNDGIMSYAGAAHAALAPGATSQTLANAADAKAVSVSTPAGTDLTCAGSQTEASQATQDAGYHYPLGLVRLCFTTPSTNNQVTATFITSLKPGQVTARHYNAATGVYSALTGAVIAQTTLNGQPALSITYSVADNGAWDEDAAVGAITDPVGLAVSIAPGTGLGAPRPVGSLAWILAALSVVAIGLSLRLSRR